MHLALLIAKPNDLGAWLEVGIPLVLALFYAIAQIFNRDRKTPPTAKPARPTPRPLSPVAPTGNLKRVPAPPGAGRSATPQKPDPLLAEIQKFLKQANQPKPGPTRPQPSGGRPPRIEQVPSRSGRVVDDSPARPLDSLQGRLLDTAEVGASAAHLTDDMKRGDLEREQHFEETFGHKLGSLTDTSVAGAKAIAADAPLATIQSNEPAPVVVALNLRTTPDDLLRAFMLNEVLQRPEHRW
jgi:hypothetical protein